MEPNNHLTNAKYIAHKKVVGPECAAFGQDGLLYTGTKNGQIVRVNPETDAVQTVVQIGDEDLEFCRKYLLFYCVPVSICNNFFC